MTREETVWMVKNIFGEEASKNDVIVQSYMDVNEIAMDEFAKTEAISFSKWRDEKYIEPVKGYGYVTLVDYYSIHDLSKVEKNNLEQLYTLYLKDKNHE